MYISVASMHDLHHVQPFSIHTYSAAPRTIARGRLSRPYHEHALVRGMSAHNLLLTLPHLDGAAFVHALGGGDCHPQAFGGSGDIRVGRGAAPQAIKKVA